MNFTSDSILSSCIFMIPVILSLSVHEWAHAYVANMLGDDTARLQGRMTLDPLAHIDPIGTLILPLLQVPFGWAKPVPVNPARLTQKFSQKFSLLLIAAAGPLSNIFLALISFFALYFSSGTVHQRLNMDEPVTYFFLLFFNTNLALAIFNMIPIPPLDGSKILDALVPDLFRGVWERFQSYSSFALLALVLSPMLFGVSPIWTVLSKILQLLP